MWEAMQTWRRENRVDTIHEWFHFNERADVDRVFPTGLHMTDKELGRVNIASLYTVSTEERIRLAHIAENERLRRTIFPACSRRMGRHIGQLFTIIDLDGLAFGSMMRVTGLLKMYMAMDTANYPEMLARMAIINAPGWFSTSWSMIKGVLSPDTRSKIEIVGTDYVDTLLRYIPREHLLTQYGGTSRGVLTDNSGPWQQPETPVLEPLGSLLPPPPAPPRLSLAKSMGGDADAAQRNSLGGEKEAAPGSLSGASSDTAQCMAAPLLSNFLASEASSPHHHQQPPPLAPAPPAAARAILLQLPLPSPV
ncbi:SEC14 cytosolic factor [Tetrabaena socialis]|uniref:SEC14 cytosolic factor n=1 Tax=Tetrabaena socialis TaxID=47790 RepID=A0A2J8AFN5_9CHLO|nr:SEC14 cytosolic factor [Tetrabaena socialis]|eukprot:PNH11335.1 SEC14 cytosolic factor [Tetrabaena socialis]